VVKRRGDKRQNREKCNSCVRLWLVMMITRWIILTRTDAITAVFTKFSCERHGCARCHISMVYGRDRDYSRVNVDGELRDQVWVRVHKLQVIFSIDTAHNYCRTISRLSCDKVQRLLCFFLFWFLCRPCEAYDGISIETMITDLPDPSFG
jgi:hypothetical protein